MPKINAGLTVSGNIEGYSIYTLNGKWVLRKAGGFKGNRIKKDPNYEKTRQSNQEFAVCAGVGKHIRRVLHPYLKPMRIAYVHNYLLRLLQSILRLDTIHPPGQRTLFEGMQSPQAKEWIQKFEFDPKHPFNAHFSISYAQRADWVLDVLHVEPIKQYSDLGATRMTLRLLCVGFDGLVHQAATLLESEEVTIALHEKTASFCLTLPDEKVSHDHYFFLLHAVYEDEAGKPLKSGMKLI